MHDIRERVERAKRDAFLRGIASGAAGADGASQTGDVGDRLGLPYEEALRLVTELERDGMAVTEDELRPPHGPAVRLTRSGAGVAARLEAA